MIKRTCTMTGCDRAHRARGLCSSHYNQEHAPDRHKKKVMACAWCGTEVFKHSGGGRKYGATCSNKCRSALQGDRSKLGLTHSNLPPEHWALWFGKTCEWPRYPMADCIRCKESYLPKSLNQRFCTALCSSRWHHHERVRKAGGTLASVTLATIRSCVWCEQPYNHASIGRLHCSDLCRDEAKQDRGAVLHHGWIHRSQRLAIYVRDNHTCWLCGEAVDYTANPKTDDWAPSLDHVIPRSKGGTHEASNLKTAHRWCNSVRSDNEDHELFETAA